MSSSDKTAEYAVTADASGFESGMQKAITAAKDAQSQIAASMGGLGDAFKLVQSHLAAFTAVLGGGKMFKDGIAETVRLTGETGMLAKSLGISMTAASTLNVALKGIGSSADVYTESNAKLIKQVRTNEEGVKAMGVATRGANGELLNGQQLMSNAIGALKGYKEGTDRNMAAQELFGKGAAEASALMKLNGNVMEQAAVKAAALGLVIGPEQAAKTKAYKEALNEVKLVIEGIMNTIGQAAMPVFTEMAQWFAATGPTAVGVFKAVLGEVGNVFQIVMDVARELWSDLTDVFNGVVQIITDAVGGDIAKNFEFWKSLMTVVQVAALGLKNGIVLAFEIIRGTVLVLMQDLKTFAAVAVAAMHLDWDGVKSAWADGTAASEKIIEDSQARIVAKSAKTAEEMQQALMGGAPKAKDAAPKAATGKSFVGSSTPDGKENSDKFKAQAAVMRAELEGQLTIQKEFLTEAQEYYNDAYKHNLLTTDAFYAAKLAIERQGIKGAIGIKEEELRQTQALEARAQKTGKQSDVLGLKAQELKITAELTVLNAQAANSEVKNTRELNDALLQKKDAMLEIQRVSQQQAGSAQIDRERIMIEQAKALRQMSDVEAIQAEGALQERLYQIDLQALRAKEQQFDGNLEKIAANNAAIEQLERTHQANLLKVKSQTTVAENKNMTDMYGSMQSGLQGVLKQAMTGSLTLRGIFQGAFSAVTNAVADMLAKTAAQWAMDAILKKALGSATALGEITAQAGVAGAAAVASTAAIPVVGPGLAPAAGAAAFSAAMSFAPLASARGGYDIPAGINPLTQLHEKEMVLPQAQADAVRDMAGGGSGGGDIHIHGSPNDSIKLKDLAVMMRRMNRNAVFVS